LILMMAALAIAMALFASWVRTAILERRALRMAEYRLQADWLARSALGRARARVAADQKYEGEAWNLPASQLGGREAGKILIRVEQDSSNTEQRLVHVEAIYPADDDRQARRRLNEVISLSALGTSQ
jgi:hypothetical protein